jgi:hypothetical protein
VIKLCAATVAFRSSKSIGKVNVVDGLFQWTKTTSRRKGACDADDKDDSFEESSDEEEEADCDCAQAQGHIRVPRVLFGSAHCTFLYKTNQDNFFTKVKLEGN